MLIVLSYIAVVLGFLGFSLPAFVTFIPRIGVSLLHRLKLKQLFLASFALLLSIGIFVVDQSGSPLITMILVIVFVSHSFLRQPELIFPALDNPLHVGKEDTDLSDDAMVMALDKDGVAVAGPLEEIVMPRHIVNDHIGKTPNTCFVLSSLPQWYDISIKSEWAETNI